MNCNCGCYKVPPSTKIIDNPSYKKLLKQINKSFKTLDRYTHRDDFDYDRFVAMCNEHDSLTEKFWEQSIWLYK